MSRDVLARRSDHRRAGPRNLTVTGERVEMQPVRSRGRPAESGALSSLSSWPWACRFARSPGTPGGRSPGEGRDRGRATSPSRPADPGLQGVRRGVLLCTAPVDSAAAVIERLASELRRLVVLPRRIGHRIRPSSSRPNGLECTPRSNARLSGGRTRVDLRSAGDVRVERGVLAGAPRSGRGTRSGGRRVWPRRPDRRARRRGRSGARPLRGWPRGARLRPHGPRVAEPGAAGQPDRRRARSSDSVRGVVARGVPRARRRLPGPLPSSTCCSPRGARRWDARPM